MIEGILKGCRQIKETVVDVIGKIKMGNLSTDYAFKSMNEIESTLSEVQKDITHLGNEVQRLADEMEKFAKYKQFEDSIAITSCIEYTSKWLAMVDYTFTEEDVVVVRKYQKEILRILLNHAKLYQRLIDNNKFYTLSNNVARPVAEKLQEWENEVTKTDKLIFQVNNVK